MRYLLALILLPSSASAYLGGSLRNHAHSSTVDGGQISTSTFYCNSDQAILGSSVTAGVFRGGVGSCSTVETAGSTTTITGGKTFEGDVVILSSLTITQDGYVSIRKPVHLASATFITGDLTASATALFNGYVHAGSSVEVDGAMSIDSALSIGGAATFSGSVDVSGAFSLAAGSTFAPSGIFRPLGVSAGVCQMISSATWSISGSATISITPLVSTGMYHAHFTARKGQSNVQDLLRVNGDSGTNYGYDYMAVIAGSVSGGAATNASAALLMPSAANAAEAILDCDIWVRPKIQQPRVIAMPTRCQWQGAAGSESMFWSANTYTASADVTSLGLLFGAGAVDGRWELERCNDK